MSFGYFKDEKELLSFRAGETIFEQGDAGNVMYGVAGGEVDIWVRGKLVETVGEGGIFGEMALIDDSPRSATAKARTDCKVAAISERRFLFMVEHAPFFALEVMQTLARRLRHVDRLAWGEQ
jgi:CRP-like cAMP-binding protein